MHRKFMPGMTDMRDYQGKRRKKDNHNNGTERNPVKKHIHEMMRIPSSTRSKQTSDIGWKWGKKTDAPSRSMND